ncbi:PTS beta-glucoside transporter subunit IIBCA [Clostridium sp. MCC353]|uniref:PTS beta-glucoside transporter subunit IIBCA n=1 Tax=Clostridium sp. MCC353 TaxID=2592646 RepID=UPI001C016F61|nr:PTS transporter subunit IIBCA [Clostridium sp. MCC353]MBT9776436.1 PTS beta-glucoside transporter subunit IIBCA [Clostridium sp. MCC353]
MGENRYRETAVKIVELVGRDNIVSATHCATRLRFVVKDKSRIDDKAVEKVDQVKGVFFTSGQYQIILGTGIVNKVYEEISKMGLNTLTKQEQDELLKEQQKGIKYLMRVLADIFVPIIPIIAATGLFLGLKGCIFNDNVLGLFGMSSAMIPQYIQTLVSVLTETAFAFLPAIICWSAFRVFGGTPVIGLVIGLMLVSPSLPNAYAVADPKSGVDAIMAFGVIPIVGCQGSVLTAILTGFLGAKLEKKLRKIMPDVLDLIFTPFLVMLVMLLAVMLGIGPVMHLFELKLVNIIEALIHLPFGIGGFIIGFTYPLAVITGLHHTYVMIETSLLANTGFNPLITLCAMYGFANVGTCLAFMVKTKKQSIKATSIGAMLSQLFGISEPVLFGIQLRYNLKPLLVMLTTSGLGAALLSIFRIQSNSYGLAVIPSYLMYIYEGRQFLFYLLISVFTVVCCFVLTCLFAIPQEVAGEEDGNADIKEKDDKSDQSIICAPISGRCIPLEEVKDEMFASKMLGDGFAIEPSSGTVVSPVDGTVIAAYPTGHAYGIRTEEGMELLIHIGIDTVELNGDGFKTFVEQGQKITRGQRLAQVELEKIRQRGKDPVTMVLFTSGEKMIYGEMGRPEEAGMPMKCIKIRKPCGKPQKNRLY